MQTIVGFVQEKMNKVKEEVGLALLVWESCNSWKITEGLDFG